MSYVPILDMCAVRTQMREISKMWLIPFPFRKHEKQVETNRKQTFKLPSFLLSRFADTNLKSSFALISYLHRLQKSHRGSKYFRLSFHGSTWQTRRRNQRKRGKAARPDSVVFQFHISILSAGASMEIRRGGHAFRVPILSSNEY